MDIKTSELASADSLTLAREAVKLLLEKKGIDVKMYYVEEVTSITDYYVNVTGRSSTQVAALADELSDSFSSRGKPAYRLEGRQGNSWILVDFGSLIVNVFDSESRNLYNFDRHLPAECGMNIDDLVAEVDAKYKNN